MSEKNSDFTVNIKAIERLLPQTQCGRCGYPRCRDYARALARSEAGLNRCPPGGENTIAALSALLGQPIQVLDPECGAHAPPVRAKIVEKDCIGCTKCIQACPTDAIIGAAKRMHNVIEAECTGCELCLPPCPVDCITLISATKPAMPSTLWPKLYDSHAISRARRRTISRLRRLARLNRERVARSAPDIHEHTAHHAKHDIQRDIAAAVARVKARRDSAQ